MRSSIGTLLALLVAVPALAGEGKWTPQQVLQQGPAWVKAQGFALPLERLWDEKAGGGLLANAVQLPGCSGSFISAEGLLITNHHCAVGILQEHSTPQANLSRDGYLARTRADEKKAGAYRIQVPRAFRDVTKEVLAAVPAGASDLARFQAVEAQQKALVAECEKRPDTRCQFAEFDGGLFFTLTEFEEIKDVRLVYAPPLGVGNYGGETDNWSWPRHTGDFSLLRAYKDGQPYRPRYFFPVSTKGVREGDAVAVLGYPGRSYRSWIADEMKEREERWFPAVRDLYAEWIRILEEEGARSPEAGIAVADDLRGLENTQKNAEGQIAGLRRGRIVEKQRKADERVRAWAGKRPDGTPALEAYAGLEKLNAERLGTWDRDFLLDMASRGPRALRWPLTLARRSTEGTKPDAEREIGYMERDLARMRDQLERDQKRYAEAADRRLFRSWVKHALALPAGQRIPAVDAAFAGAADDAALDARIAGLCGASRVFDLAARKAMFDEAPEALKARRDPLVDLGFALDVERKALKDRRDAAAGATLAPAPGLEEGGDRRGRPPRGAGREQLAARDLRPRAGLLAARGGDDGPADDAGRRRREAHRPGAVRPAGERARGLRGEALRPVGGPRARPGADRHPERLRHDRRQLGQPDDRRRGAPRRRELRPRVGERGQRLRLQPGRGAQRQRRRALPAVEPRRDRGRARTC